MRFALRFLVIITVIFISCSDNRLGTDSGIKYDILVDGAGKIPEKGQIVLIHYTGTLINGKKFDSSYDIDRPFSFIAGVGNVIQGMDEVLLLMNTGSRWLVTIPSELAYKEKGISGVPPNSDLLFDIDLLGVLDKEFVLDSGIRYSIIERGLGTVPQNGQTVVVHYNFWLSDWEKYDSSFSSGKPVSLTMGEESPIPFWDSILSIMPVGSRWKVFFPSETAYGEKGYGRIPPNSDLIFEIKLISAK